METKKELGAYLGYETKDEPKNVKIEVDKWYTISDGYGTKEIKIVSIRKMDEEIFIHYKYQKEDGKWIATWINNSVTLNTFKAQLLEYGKLTSIDIIYPKNKK